MFMGGLMRCCVATVDARTEPAKDGERQPCQHCSSGAVFTEMAVPDQPNARGVWRWDRS